jgi:TPR repeat protein
MDNFAHAGGMLAGAAAAAAFVFGKRPITGWLTAVGLSVALLITGARPWQRTATPAQIPTLARFGKMYATGDGLPRDPRRAEELFRRACEAGSEDGCVSLRALTARPDPTPRD